MIASLGNKQPTKRIAARRHRNRSLIPHNVRRGLNFGDCTARSLIRAYWELVSVNHQQPGSHIEMPRPAEFMTRHGIFARSREPHVSLGDRARHNLDMEIRAARGEVVSHVRAGDSKMNRNPCGDQHALGYETITLRNHPYGD